MRKRKFLVALVNATSSHGHCSCPIFSLESNLVFTELSSGSEKIPTLEYPVGQQSAEVAEDTVCTPLSHKQPCFDEEKNASGTVWEDESSTRQSHRNKRSKRSSGSTLDSGTEPYFCHNVC